MKLTHMHVARPVNMVQLPPLLQKPSLQRGKFIGRRLGGYALVVDGRVMKTGARLVGSMCLFTTKTTKLFCTSDINIV